MDDLHSKTAGILNLIDTIQINMVAEAEGQPGIPALSPVQIRQTGIGTEIQYKLLSKPFNTAPVEDFLLPGCSSRQELILALTNYKNFISGLNSGKNIQKYLSLLDPSILLPGENNKPGEISLMSGLHSLELLKNSLLTVESYMLISLAYN
jgi:hypothetical protein